MKFSYSRVGCFKNCPRQYKYRYIDRIKMPPSQDPANALYVGTAVHKGIETDSETAITEYLKNFYLPNDLCINETIKIEEVVRKVEPLIPENAEFEVKLESPNFVGFIDMLVEVKPNVFDIYDFKYSNAIDRYMESGQLQVYKYMFELLYPGAKVRNLYFMFIPKLMIRQKKSETLETFRRRLRSELDKRDVRVMKVEDSLGKVGEFFEGVWAIQNAKSYPPQQSGLCRFCDYQEICLKEQEGSNEFTKE